jgi:zinc/manganese transport system substrate-binding protein
MFMKRTIWAVISIAVVLIVLAVSFFAFGHRGTILNTTPGGAIKIVAAEDFYGNIAQQLGGDKVSVTSIISNPNVDPHEYESSVQDGIAITDANIVIENGLQYDSWMDKLLSASPKPDRVLIVAGNVAPDLLQENPHIWYGIDNISTIAGAIERALVKADPVDAPLFQNNLAAFNASLTPISAKIDDIRAQYGGTAVGLTETIYLYQTEPMRLGVLTPFNFEKAIAEGNDPSAQDVNTANRQIASKQISVFIYNSQTVTPVTTNLQNAARANGIPVVPVTEMMPPGDTYQTWMMDELSVLSAALVQSQ